MNFAACLGVIPIPRDIGALVGRAVLCPPQMPTNVFGSPRRRARTDASYQCAGCHWEMVLDCIPQSCEKIVRPLTPDHQQWQPCRWAPKTKDRIIGGRIIGQPPLSERLCHHFDRWMQSNHGIMPEPRCEPRRRSLTDAGRQPALDSPAPCQASAGFLESAFCKLALRMLN